MGLRSPMVMTSGLDQLSVICRSCSSAKWRRSLCRPGQQRTRSHSRTSRRPGGLCGLDVERGGAPATDPVRTLDRVEASGYKVKCIEPAIKGCDVQARVGDRTRPVKNKVMIRALPVIVVRLATIPPAESSGPLDTVFAREEALAYTAEVSPRGSADGGKTPTETADAPALSKWSLPAYLVGRTKDPQGTSIRERRRPDAQSRMREWFQGKTAADLLPQSDCEIPTEL